VATRTDITDGWYVGDDQVLAIPVVDAAGASFPLTGMSLEFVLRVYRSNGDGALAFSKTTEITLGDTGPGTDDVALIPVAAADTADLSENVVYEYVLRRVDDGSVVTLKWGTAHLKAGADRAAITSI